MKTLLIPAAVLAMLLAPAAADAAPCRNAKGQFAKCGAPGAMTDAQYKAMKGKPMMMMAKPMVTEKGQPLVTEKGQKITTEPAPAPAPAPKPMMMAAKPAKPMMMMAAKPAAPAKKVCKDGKGKFIKCK